jgi:N-acetyl-gamma-glutamyl-phosphate reductase
VAPFFRGISLTIAAELQRGQTAEGLLDQFQAFFARCPLVAVREAMPEVQEVRGTHGVVLGGFSVSGSRSTRIALVAVLDNLLKGAATQAVQNLNLAFGLDGLAGLDWQGGEQA